MLRATALSLSRRARMAHTMSADAYTKSPDSFKKVLDTFKMHRACAVLRTPKAELCPPAMQAAMHVDAARASGSIPWSLPKDTSNSMADDGAFLLTQSRSFLVVSLKIC